MIWYRCVCMSPIRLTSRARQRSCPGTRWVCAGRAEAYSSRPELRVGWLDNRDAMLLLVLADVPPRERQLSRTSEGEPSPVRIEVCRASRVPRNVCGIRLDRARLGHAGLW